MGSIAQCFNKVKYQNNMDNMNKNMPRMDVLIGIYIKFTNIEEARGFLALYYNELTFPMIYRYVELEDPEEMDHEKFQLLKDAVQLKVTPEQLMYQ